MSRSHSTPFLVASFAGHLFLPRLSTPSVYLSFPLSFLCLPNNSRLVLYLIYPLFISSCLPPFAFSLCSLFLNSLYHSRHPSPCFPFHSPLTFPLHRHYLQPPVPSSFLHPFPSPSASLLSHYYSIYPFTPPIIIYNF